MQKISLIATVLFASFPCFLFAHKVPDSEWQKGTLEDIQFVEESYEHWMVYQGNGVVHGGTYSVQHFTIETQGMVYEAVPKNGITGIGLDKGRFDFTVNSTYMFAIEKATLYLRDSNGKQGTFLIIKKTLKQQAELPVSPKPAKTNDP